MQEHSYSHLLVSSVESMIVIHDFCGRREAELQDFCAHSTQVIPSGHRSIITACSLIGSHIFTGSYDGQLRKTDVNSGESTLAVETNNSIYALKAAGPHLLSAGTGGDVFVWEIATMTLQKRLRTASVLSIFALDSFRLSTDSGSSEANSLRSSDSSCCYSDCAVRRSNGNGSEATGVFEQSHPSLSQNAMETWFAAATGRDCRLTIWNLSTGTQALSLPQLVMLRSLCSRTESIPADVFTFSKRESTDRSSCRHSVAGGDGFNHKSAAASARVTTAACTHADTNAATATATVRGTSTLNGQYYIGQATGESADATCSAIPCSIHLSTGSMSSGGTEASTGRRPSIPSTSTGATSVVYFFCGSDLGPIHVWKIPAAAFLPTRAHEFTAEGTEGTMDQFAGDFSEGSANRPTAGSPVMTFGRHAGGSTTRLFDYQSTAGFTTSALASGCVNFFPAAPSFSFNGHTDVVTAVVVLEADGRFRRRPVLLSSSRDGTVRLWDYSCVDEKMRGYGCSGRGVGGTSGGSVGMGMGMGLGLGLGSLAVLRGHTATVSSLTLCVSQHDCENGGGRDGDIGNTDGRTIHHAPAASTEEKLQERMKQIEGSSLRSCSSQSGDDSRILWRPRPCLRVCPYALSVGADNRAVVWDMDAVSADIHWARRRTVMLLATRLREIAPGKGAAAAAAETIQPCHDAQLIVRSQVADLCTCIHGEQPALCGRQTGSDGVLAGEPDRHPGVDILAGFNAHTPLPSVVPGDENAQLATPVGDRCCVKSSVMAHKSIFSVPSCGLRDCMAVSTSATYLPAMRHFDFPLGFAPSGKDSGESSGAMTDAKEVCAVDIDTKYQWRSGEGGMLADCATFATRVRGKSRFISVDILTEDCKDPYLIPNSSHSTLISHDVEGNKIAMLFCRLFSHPDMLRTVVKFL